MAIACQLALQLVVRGVRRLAEGVERDDYTRSGADLRNLEADRGALVARQDSLHAWLAEPHPPASPAGIAAAVRSAPAPRAAMPC